MKDARIEKFTEAINNQEQFWGSYELSEQEKNYFEYDPLLQGYKFKKDVDINTVGVHSQEFHADDVLCVALLKAWRKFKLIRSRDKNELSTCDILMDVGEGLLDHHGVRADKEHGIAACTRLFLAMINSSELELSWDGDYYLKSEEKEYEASRLWELVQTVASFDVGAPAEGAQHPFPFVHVATQYATCCEESQDDKFNWAVDRVSDILEMLVRTWAAEFWALETAKAVIQEDQEILVFPKEARPATAKEMLYEAKARCIFYVSPQGEEDWRILCAADPEKPFSGFSSRKLIPERFRGLREQQLSEATGIPGGIFCHKDGFIAGFTSKESAVRFAELCLKG